MQSVFHKVPPTIKIHRRYDLKVRAQMLRHAYFLV